MYTSLGSGALSAECPAGPISSDIFCLLHWIRKKPRSLKPFYGFLTLSTIGPY